MAHTLAPPGGSLRGLAGVVSDISFDPEQPPVDPPADVAQPLLWAMSRQVYGDHDVPDDDGGPMVPRCRLCDEVWPCPPRRTAERGLLAACRAPQPSRGRPPLSPGRRAPPRPKRPAVEAGSARAPSATCGTLTDRRCPEWGSA